MSGVFTSVKNAISKAIGAFSASLASSNGSSLIGFVQAGTGAVTLTAQQKLRNEIHDTDFSTIQAAINALTSGKKLIISNDYTLSAGLTIANKSRIHITGKGSLTLSGASSSEYIFNLVGVIDDLEIDGLTLVGENNPSYSQSGIGNNSGQTISNVRFHDLNIRKINVGISLNADLGGSYVKGKVYNNDLKDLIGNVAGSGYGIHLSKAMDCQVYGNTIDNASRHSIYQAKGDYCNNSFFGNTIRNHRSTVADATYRAAISCSRSSSVTIANNKFIDGYDGAINVDHDTSGGFDCSNVLIIGNSFVNSRNTIPNIIIGEQLVPTTKSTYKIDIVGNVFDEDMTHSGGSSIIILNGTQICIKNNRFRKYNVTTVLPQCVEMGHDSYATADAHISDITITNNEATSDNAVVGSRFAYVANRLCVGQSPYKIKDNSINGFASEFVFGTNPVNLNSKLKFTASLVIDIPTIAAQGAYSGAYTVPGVKPKSVVTMRPQYTIAFPLGFQAMAHDGGVNAIGITMQNSTTSDRDWPSQTIIFSVEDF